MPNIGDSVLCISDDTPSMLVKGKIYRIVEIADSAIDGDFVVRLENHVWTYLSKFTLIKLSMLPCPFCGGAPEISHCEEACCGARPRWIQCKCGCELGGLWYNDEEAIRDWNKRYDSGRPN